MSNQRFEDNNTGIIGKNDFKTDVKHPDQRGRSKIGGIWYWVSAWEKTSADGRKFLSLAYTEMTQEEADKVIAKQNARQAPQRREGEHQQGQGVQRQNAPQQQQQQSAPQQSAPVQNNEPPMDFDDDIPF